jgi:hypothetical protein
LTGFSTSMSTGTVELRHDGVVTPHDRDRSDDHQLWDAAIEAELQTGDREATFEAARSHLLVRIARICGGFALLLAGVVLMILPGPGLVLLIAGLSLLAVDVPFARRLRDVLIARADRATSFVPKKLKLVLVVVGTVVGVGLSALLLLR